MAASGNRRYSLGCHPGYPCEKRRFHRVPCVSVLRSALPGLVCTFGEPKPQYTPTTRVWRPPRPPPVPKQAREHRAERLPRSCVARAIHAHQRFGALLPARLAQLPARGASRGPPRSKTAPSVQGGARGRRTRRPPHRCKVAPEGAAQMCDQRAVEHTTRPPGCQSKSAQLGRSRTNVSAKSGRSPSTWLARLAPCFSLVHSVSGHRPKVPPRGTASGPISKPVVSSRDRQTRTDQHSRGAHAPKVGQDPHRRALRAPWGRRSTHVGLNAERVDSAAD